MNEIVCGAVARGLVEFGVTMCCLDALCPMSGLVSVVLCVVQLCGIAMCCLVAVVLSCVAWLRR